MAKLTLLDITQDILSDMSSDNVSSISDTAESERVAAIIKSTYFKVMEEKNWPHLGQTFQLTGLGDVTKPTHMQIPETIRRVKWLKYDTRKLVGNPTAYNDITYLDPEEFVNVLNGRDNTAANVQVVSDNVTLNIRNDVAPSYWTSFDDTNIVFDSFDSTLDTTLQQSKTQCFGYYEPVWGTSFTAHATNTTHVLEDVIAVVDSVSGNTYYYRCSVAGTTAGVAPAYSTIIGATTVDGTAAFVNVGLTAIDAFIPDLPAHLFPMLLTQAKAQCFNKLKQVVDSQEERDAKRQRLVMQLKDHKNRQDGEKRKFGYGRK